jgi:hypothetical protein
MWVVYLHSRECQDCGSYRNGYEEYVTGKDYELSTIQVPAGVPAALQNIGDQEAYMLNMPSPA